MKTASVLKISHLAIMVKDLKIAKTFYTDLLNVEEMDKPDFFIKGLWYKLGNQGVKPTMEL